MKKYINSLDILSQQELNQIDSFLSNITVSKGDVLLQQGNVSNKLYIVKSGVLCSLYESDKAEEIINCMAFENEFCCSFMSFISHTPSHESIIALLDSNVLAIEQIDLENLFNSSIGWQKVGRKLIEHQYTLMEKHFTSFQQNSSAIRYEFLLRNYPQQVRIIPQRYIASYLGISTRQLTRLRKSIF